jgi:hypothetical protein
MSELEMGMVSFQNCQASKKQTNKQTKTKQKTTVYLVSEHTNLLLP